MAKYTVTHSCGHQHEYQFFGKYEDRYKKLDWLEGMPCPECRVAAEKAAAAAEREKQQGLNLPDLKGTPKQMAWAEDIRAQFVAGVLAAAAPGVDAFAQWGQSELGLAVARLTSATFWIDNLSASTEALARICRREYKNLSGLLD